MAHESQRPTGSSAGDSPQTVRQAVKKRSSENGRSLDLGLKNKMNISDGENTFRQLYQQIERLKAVIRTLLDA